MTNFISSIAHELNQKYCPCKEAFVVGAVSWLTYSVSQVGFLQGAGFGAIAALASSFAFSQFKKMGLENKYLNLGLSGAVGGVVAYGATVAAAAAGIVSAPITVPTAVVLTIVTLASMAIELKCDSEWGESANERKGDLCFFKAGFRY